jgi:hypothetical protein
MPLIQSPRSPQQVVVDGTLLDAQAANTNGVWSNISRIVPWSVTIRGTFSGATVTIYVSNQVVRPLDTDNLQAVFQAFTAPGSTGSTIAFRWVKAQVTGIGGGGAITVDVLGGA